MSEEMTNKDAISRLTMLKDKRYPKMNKALDKGIAALEAEPTMTTNARSGYVTIKAEPCEDAISRQAAIDALKKYFSDDGMKDTEYGAYWHHVHVIDVLQGMPSVTPKQKTGCWVEVDDEPHEVWECDHCGFVIDGSGCIEPYEYRDTYKFCPNCGAKMEGEPNGEISREEIAALLARESEESDAYTN